MKVEIVGTHDVFRDIPEKDMPKDHSQFWNWMAFELRNLMLEAARAKDAQIVFAPYRKDGEQYIWEFFCNDLALPRGSGMNWHGQNTSQWLYAGAIVLQHGAVSAHH